MKAINLEKIESNLSLGTYTGLAQLDCLLIGPKVESAEQVDLLKKAGITNVIDMKTEGEFSFKDKEEFEKAGISYFHFPVSSPFDVDISRLQELESKIRCSEIGKTYLYCMSGNRVSVILGRLFFEVCGHPKDRVLDTIAKLGMTRADLLEKMKVDFAKDQI